jgi:hypothetical protein
VRSPATNRTVEMHCRPTHHAAVTLIRRSPWQLKTAGQWWGVRLHLYRAPAKDRLRTPITAQKRDQGGVVLRGRRNFIALSESEFDRLTAFVRNEAKLQRHPISAAP